MATCEVSVTSRALLRVREVVFGLKAQQGLLRASLSDQEVSGGKT